MHISIPHYKGLSIDNLLVYARNSDGVMMALPVEKEIHKLTRQYLANVIYTIVGEPFSQWVDQMVEQRNSKIKADG